jgi:hypothetical protein
MKTRRRMFGTVQNGAIKWRPMPRLDFVLRQPVEALTVAVLAGEIIGVVAARSNNLCNGAQTPERVSHSRSADSMTAASTVLRSTRRRSDEGVSGATPEGK